MEVGLAGEDWRALEHLSEHASSMVSNRKRASKASSLTLHPRDQLQSCNGVVGGAALAVCTIA